jgi:hypothetical protein
MHKPIDRSTPANTEVRVPRTFSAKYKLDILKQIDAATERGEVGRIQRREGLYSSLITSWRNQRDEGALTAMNNKRGPTSNKLTDKIKRLREQNARLEERLSTAEELVQAQGKAFALLQQMSRKSDEQK